RCLATTANPETGLRDADTLGILQTWDHQDFCVYARVLNAGTIHLNDSAKAPNQ
ncbi:MAG: molybdenum cofactor biosysynthesis protein, partial [Paracoccaceae bacterium]